MRVLVIPLGELGQAQAGTLVDAHFGVGERLWFERGALRRTPLRTLIGVWRRRLEAAVLVAPDLARSRLRVTSLLLALPRADSYWRIDAHGRCERWSLGGHLAHHLGAVLRHALACALALLLGETVLRLIEGLVSAEWTSITEKRHRPWHIAADARQASQARQLPQHHAHQPLPHSIAHVPSVTRILYLRSQLWLGLTGGGSVAHTAGVIGGLQQLGVHVLAVSSDTLTGVTAPVRVIAPEVWFDGWLRELEDLAYNIPYLLGSWHAARAFKPDAIYQRHTAFNVTGAILAKLLRVPLVLEYNSSEVWKGRYWGGLRLERAAQRVERINLGAADRIVVVSRVLRDELIDQGILADRILVNPNGVDPTLFRPDRSGAEVRSRLGLGSKIVVGFSGTFGAWHGIPTLAAAIPIVLAARDNVRWLLIGDGPLRGLVDDVTAGEDHVVRVGMVPHAEMPDHLAACDVLVSPHGRQADGGEFFGSPTKLYEYMASGRPIVASRLGQIAEVLEDEVTALLVEPDNAQALADAIVRLVDDASLRGRLGCAARDAAEQRHTWRQNAQRVIECLGIGA